MSCVLCFLHILFTSFLYITPILYSLDSFSPFPPSAHVVYSPNPLSVSDLPHIHYSMPLIFLFLPIHLSTLNSFHHRFPLSICHFPHSRRQLLLTVQLFIISSINIVIIMWLGGRLYHGCVLYRQEREMSRI